MTQKERGQIEVLTEKLENLEDKVIDMNVTIEKIVLLLNDDSYSSNKGILTRMNFVEETVQRLQNFMFNAKWLIAAVCIPVFIEVIKKLIHGVQNGFKIM